MKNNNYTTRFLGQENKSNFSRQPRCEPMSPAIGLILYTTDAYCICLLLFLNQQNFS